MERCVFLDRDGVIVPDDGLINDCEQVQLLAGVPEALARLRDNGFRLIVITNQPIIARGLAAEAEVAAVNETIERLIVDAGGPALTRFYVCPHHPRADVESYRADCDCRKPRPGLLKRAAAAHDLDLPSSYMVGDRMSDVIAGFTAGCTTVLVESGRHTDPFIETSMEIDPRIAPDFVCGDLTAAVDWILSR